MFRKTFNVHSYNTRLSTSGNFYDQISRLEIYKRSFSRFGVRLWNEISRRIRDLPQKDFKGEIGGFLLNILVNDYIETPIIVQIIGLASYLQLVNFCFSLIFRLFFWGGGGVCYS